MQRDGEEEDQEKSHPVDGKADPEVGDAEPETVYESAGIAGTEDSERDAAGGGKQHRRAGELKGLRKTLEDVPEDRPVGDVGPTEVPLGDAGDVVTELDGQRIVQAELGAKTGDRLLVGALAHHGLHRIARRDVEEQEGDHEDAEQRRDGEEESPQDEGTHL